MKIINRLIKKVIFSLIALTPLATISVVSISCGSSDSGGGHKPSDKYTFADFAKDAEAESAYNIVMNANPSVNGWGYIDAKDLSKPDFDTVNETKVRAGITNTKLHKNAVFSISYNSKVKYDFNNWQCVSQ